MKGSTLAKVMLTSDWSMLPGLTTLYAAPRGRTRSNCALGGREPVTVTQTCTQPGFCHIQVRIASWWPERDMAAHQAFEVAQIA